MKLHQKRFDELTVQLEELERSKTPYHDEGGRGGRYTIDGNDLLGWKVKVRNLLTTICGTDSQYFQQFEKNEHSSYRTNYESLEKLKAIFLAAKEDFEGGYLSSFRSIVQAELFDSELDQARELAQKGFILAAGVVAGVVLETTLRELCDRESLPRGKLDKMNADLAKTGVYGKLVQKRITALANVRNSAAHGHPEEFSPEDVQDMIRDVERFVRENLS